MSNAPLAAEQEPGRHLACSLEAQSEYPPGKPVIVKGTLHNSGDVDIWILRSGTFLDADWGSTLVLTLDGEFVPYLDVAAFRVVTLDGESCVRIAAGQSLSREIDIAEKYAVAEPGDYQAHLHMAIVSAFDPGGGKPPSDPNQYALTIVESQNVPFRIPGEASAAPLGRRARAAGIPASVSAEAPAAPTADFPAEPKMPEFKPDRAAWGGQADKFEHGHRLAYRNIKRALQSFENADNTDTFKNWFGQSGDRGRVKKRLAAMATWMSQQKYEYAKTGTEEGGRVAETYRGTRNSGAKFIRFFNIAFGSFWYGEYAPEFVITHEVSHGARATEDGDTGTEDREYFKKQVLELAEQDPRGAAENAQSYAYFVETFGDSHPPPPLGNRPPIREALLLRAHDARTQFARPVQSGMFRVEELDDFIVALRALGTFNYLAVNPDGVLQLSRGGRRTPVPDESFEWVESKDDVGKVALRSMSNGKFLDFKSSGPRTDGEIFASSDDPNKTFTYAVWPELCAVNDANEACFWNAKGELIRFPDLAQWKLLDVAKHGLDTWGLTTDNRIFNYNVDTGERYYWFSPPDHIMLPPKTPGGPYTEWDRSSSARPRKIALDRDGGVWFVSTDNDVVNEKKRRRATYG